MIYLYITGKKLFIVVGIYNDRYCANERNEKKLRINLGIISIKMKGEFKKSERLGLDTKIKMSETSQKPHEIDQ